MNCRYCEDVPAGSYCDECGELSVRPQKNAYLASSPRLSVGSRVSAGGLNGTVVAFDNDYQFAHVMIEGSPSVIRLRSEDVVLREIGTHENPVQLSWTDADED